MPWQTTGSQPLEVTAHPVWAEPDWSVNFFGVAIELIPFIVVLAFIFLLLSKWALQARYNAQINELRTTLEDERMDSSAMYSRLQATLDEVAFKKFCHHCLDTWEYEDPDPEIEDNSSDHS